MKTARQRILEMFRDVAQANLNKWLAIHDFNLMGISQNAAAARMRELTQDGYLECRYREGTRYKEWRLKAPGEDLAWK